MWDVLYAIDASTSMGEEARSKGGAPFVKMTAVKEGIVQVVRGAPLPYGARVGVMGFRAPTKALGMMLDSKQDIVQTVLPLSPVTELKKDLDGLGRKLDEIRVGGATPTGEAMKRAAQALRDVGEERRPRIRKLVVVTDEKSNVGPKPEEVLDASLVRAAMVDVVAIGSGTERKAFERIASRTGGRFTEVGTAAELWVALNPRIPYSDPAPPGPLIGEAERIAGVLKATDRKSASYEGVAAAAAAVLERAEAKLQDVVSVEGQARGDFDLVLAAAMNDPKWSSMSMREYADRVWSSGAELCKLQAAEEQYRACVRSLQTGPMA